MKTITEYLNDVCEDVVIRDNSEATKKTTSSNRTSGTKVEPLNDEEFEKFVKELLEFYDENTLPTDFVINIEDVVRWLSAPKKVLTRTLCNTYKLNIDYTKTKTKNAYSDNPKVNNYALYMLTPNCFKLLCMSSHSKKSHAVRRYFVEKDMMFRNKTDVPTEC